MRFFSIRIKIVTVSLGIGALGGVLIILLCQLFSLDLNQSQRWFTFWAFCMFGLIAGVINALSLRW